MSFGKAGAPVEYVSPIQLIEGFEEALFNCFFSSPYVENQVRGFCVSQYCLRTPQQPVGLWQDTSFPESWSGYPSVLSSTVFAGRLDTPDLLFGMKKDPAVVLLSRGCEYSKNKTGVNWEESNQCLPCIASYGQWIWWDTARTRHGHGGGLADGRLWRGLMVGKFQELYRETNRLVSSLEPRLDSAASSNCTILCLSLRLFTIPMHTHLVT